MSEEEIKMMEAFIKSRNTRTAEISLMGNRNTIVQIVSLLSQIRTVLKNNQSQEIKVVIGKNIQDTDFDFLVNNSRTDNMVPRDTVEIN